MSFVSESNEDFQTFKKSQSRVPVPPDGGWGWLVAIGSFFNTLLATLMIQNFSIGFSKILKDNGTSTANTAWIFNLCNVISNVTTIFLPTLCDQFGWRKVSFTGGLLISLSCVTSSFSNSVWVLFVTFSIVHGIGNGLLLHIFCLIIPKYFEKYRGRVLGFVTCGMCSGQYVGPILITHLQEGYGHRGALLIMGAVLLQVCLFSTLLHPVEWHFKRDVHSSTPLEAVVHEERQPMTTGEEVENGCKKLSRCQSGAENGLREPSDAALDLPNNTRCRFKCSNAEDCGDQCTCESSHTRSKIANLVRIFQKLVKILILTKKNMHLLIHKRMIILTFGLSLSLNLYYNFMMLLPFSVVDKGFPVKLAAYCFTTMGILNVIMRLLTSLLVDIVRISVKWYSIIGSLFLSASVLVFTYTSEEKWMLVALAFYGAGLGSIICTNPLLVIEVMGVTFLPPSIGIIGFVSLVMYLFIGPIIGYIRDLTQDYDLCLKIIALLQLVPFVLWSLIPVATKYDLRREKRQENSWISSSCSR